MRIEEIRRAYEREVRNDFGPGKVLTSARYAEDGKKRLPEIGALPSAVRAQLHPSVCAAYDFYEDGFGHQGGTRLFEWRVDGTTTIGVWAQGERVEEGCGYLEIYAEDGLVLSCATVEGFAMRWQSRDELRKGFDVRAREGAPGEGG